MAFVNYCSYTRATSARVKPTQTELPFFKGSSFNRKKHAKSTQTASQMLTEAMAALSGTDKEIFSVHSDKAFKYEVNRSGTILPREQKTRCFSSRSRNKCAEKIHALFNAGHYTNFSFLTLTFIQDLSHRDAQSILNKFLTVLRQRYGRFSYVWVAELQPKNNDRIHFHLITSKRFPISQVNALWVVQQAGSGLYHESFTKFSLLEAWQNHQYKTIQKYLNPVDVRRVDNVDALSGYLTNYITKNKSQFHCAVWHCSRCVSTLFTSAMINQREFDETCNPKINWVRTKKNKVYINKTFVVTNKENGKTLALVNTIYNKRHFMKFKYELNQLNAFILRESLKTIDPKFFHQQLSDFMQQNFSIN